MCYHSRESGKHCYTINIVTKPPWERTCSFQWKYLLSFELSGCSQKQKALTRGTMEVVDSNQQKLLSYGIAKTIDLKHNWQGYHEFDIQTAWEPFAQPLSLCGLFPLGVIFKPFIILSSSNSYHVLRQRKRKVSVN